MQPNLPHNRRFWTHGVWQVLLLALIVRSLVLVARFSELQKDPDAYRHIAETLRTQGVYAWDDARPSKALGSVPASDQIHATAFRPPLYPLLLWSLSLATGYVSTQAIAGLHLLLGLGTVILTYDLSRRWSTGLSSDEKLAEQRGFWGAVLVACDPLLLNQSTLVMTETLAAFLPLLVLWAWSIAMFPSVSNQSTKTSAGWLLAAGVFAGLAALARPTFLPWVAAMGLVTLFSSTNALKQPAFDFSKQSILCGAMFLIAAFATIVPWGIRNALVLGRPIFTTTHGGYTLWLANNPEFYNHLQNDTTGLPWQSDLLDGEVEQERQKLLARYLDKAPSAAPASISQSEWAHRQTELALDEKLRQQAYWAISHNPSGAVTATHYRWRALFRCVPNRLQKEESTKSQLLRFATGIWFGAIYVLMLVGARSLGKKLCSPEWIAAALLLATLTATHSLYFSNLRMRAPVIGLFALLAAEGLCRLRLHFTSTRSTESAAPKQAKS